jgi:V8-like Glu-specific endopeptidase
MFKGLLITLILFTGQSYAGQKTICGETDDRSLSFNPKIGRLFKDESHKGCTITLINENCGITAGHCLPVLKYAEFNTPISEEGQAQASDLKDVYEIDEATILMEHDGPGKDWAVMQLKRNEITGKFPGEVQGYYNINFNKQKIGTKLRITGYGRDSEAARNFAQQTHSGKLVLIGSSWFGDTVLAHTVDTMGGNSGSTILNDATDEIIGIHTHGGCREDGGANMGTVISEHEDLKAAIKACLNQ